MSTSITGGCLCVRVRFACAAPLAESANCHCTDCRKCTGSAFNVSVGVETRYFVITAGSPRSFTKEADSGMELTRHFCSDRGSPLFTSSSRHPDRLYVKAGALDDPKLVEPAYQSWTRSSVSWATIQGGLPACEAGRI